MPRRTERLMDRWSFTGPDGGTSTVSLPHTWNGVDGQDGGNDYQRGTGRYRKQFGRPEYLPGAERVYLEFRGVNASAEVRLNGAAVCRHDGGYSTFRADITELLKDENDLEVVVDNSVNQSVYPQKADFTFYGGIYREVRLRTVPTDHFDLDFWGSEGLKVTATPEGKDAAVRVETFYKAANAQVRVTLYDGEGRAVAEGEGQAVNLLLPNAHLWDSVDDPYLYTAGAQLLRGGEVLDEVRTRFGVRSFSIDPERGFFLNGRPYPLHGVSRHQDRPGVGNAIREEDHREDMELIREIGANTVRLAHYQHDPYFYDLCDEYGMIVWAEIPYISEHMPGGRENTMSQMRELIYQNYNHPSIVTWGISNEITISTKDKADMLENHRELNDLCHKLDPTRPTSLACYAMCGPFNPVAHITDLVSWNLYLGWYVPGFRLNDAFMWLFHKCYPKQPLGFSEYGAEGMPNLHAAKPRRGDHTEEYQARYHEYMLECFQRHPFLWSTHVWNLFDFAADARDQGGEPGMNHKGLITFDRKTKKDAFYLYKAWWSKEPFVHICSKRYVDRAESETTVKLYSNLPKVALYADGKLLGEGQGGPVFLFRISLKGEIRLEAKAGDCRDEAVIRWVEQPNPDYRLRKAKNKSQNWV